ncbi:HAD family hydrolase [Alteribacillus sp. YIM 98480]|uniref:HAD family hydrolase n=1 Tax=Alteribacillus sp. YIM 98480 TaxID=2606599 RepID=UPI00131CE6A1|nr:HAD family hydrolase [Alteribacillus sp. YIM 98480]
MPIQWNEIKTAIFDLDGTLYEDTHHFEYYAALLEEKLDKNDRNSFRKDYENMLKGKHPVAVGRVYDAVRDRVLEVDPETNRVINTWDWEGKPVTKEEEYKEPITFDFDSMIAIGDGWWLPVAAAKHYGVQSTYDAYHKTKEFMQTEAFQFTEQPERRKALKQLRDHMKLILITNSQADDVKRLLDTLDLNGIFHEVIANAKKPVHTEEHFKKIIETEEILPNEAVSLGDNYLNDIVPAENLGMNAVLIDPQGCTTTRGHTECVQSLTDLFPTIKKLQHTSF